MDYGQLRPKNIFLKMLIIFDKKLFLLSLP